jgi:hypothetical protein
MLSFPAIAIDLPQQKSGHNEELKLPDGTVKFNLPTINSNSLYLDLK